KELGLKIIVRKYYDVMGAYGAAVIARPKMGEKRLNSNFKGIGIVCRDYSTASFDLGDCVNNCEIIAHKACREMLARSGGRCGKWSARTPVSSAYSYNSFVLQTFRSMKTTTF